jgi:hypothetical protein
MNKALCVAVALCLTQEIAWAFDKQYPAYNAFLNDYVCNGGVAYKRIKAALLDSVGRELSSLTPLEYNGFSANDKIAYCINVYNFYTIVLIMRHYPLKKGIRDIRDPWGQPCAPFLGTTVTLDHLEHDVLRKQFREPRVHCVLVCASKSCPALLSRAFTGDKLDAQLRTAARAFLSDTSKNLLKGNVFFLSQIFEWYGKDFAATPGGFAGFVSEVLGVRPGFSVRFIPYDWSLNEVDKCN